MRKLLFKLLTGIDKDVFDLYYMRAREVCDEYGKIIDQDCEITEHVSDVLQNTKEIIEDNKKLIKINMDLIDDNKRYKEVLTLLYNVLKDFGITSVLIDEDKLS